MDNLIVYAILLFVLAFVLSPLVRPMRPGFDAGVYIPSAMDEWLHQKRIAEDIIGDLQFDLQTGKLSEADHRQLIERQKKTVNGIDEKIRRAEQSPRDEVTRKLLAEIKKVKEQLISSTQTVCVECGHRLGKEARFCSQCGAQVS